MPFLFRPLMFFSETLGLIHVDFGDHIGVEECGNNIHLFYLVVMVGCKGKYDT